MGKAILIVDDEPDLREIMSELLTDEGYFCLSADSKVNALKKIADHQSKGGQIDWVVTDYHMPGGSGLELFTDLREKGVQTPFLFLSGEPIDDKLAPHNGNGVLGYELKPFDLMSFVERVSTFLGSAP